MSLYLGSDNSGSKLLHLTSSHESISILKGNPTISTLFHSSLPYIQTKYISDISYYTTVKFNGQWNVYSWHAELPTEAIDLINDGYTYVILVKTTNSEGNWVVLNRGGAFSKFSGYGSIDGVSYSEFITYYDSYVNPTTKSSVPSYTNKFTEIYRLSEPGATIASHLGWILMSHAYYDNRNDNVLGAKVLVYDRKSNLMPLISPSEIFLNRNEFIIHTPTEIINMAEFYPLFSTKNFNDNSFRSFNLGSTGIAIYTPDVSTTIGWELDASVSSEPKIYKRTTSGKTLVSCTDTTKLHFVTSLTYPFTFTNVYRNTQNSTVIWPLSTTQIAIGFVDTVFYSAFTGNFSLKGEVNFIEPDLISVLCGGSSNYTSNGVYYGQTYSLSLTSDSGNIVLQAIAAKTNATGTSGSLVGSFTGTLTLYIFDYGI